MVDHYRQSCRWIEMMAVGWIIMASYSSSLCLGASGNTDAFTTGLYHAEDAAPDYLTTERPAQMAPTLTLKVQGGIAVPDRPFDEGKVVYNRDASHDATACFAGRSTGAAEGGRSTGWGCTYTVYGVFVGPGTGTVSKWWSKFDDENNARITLEVNQDGKADDYVAVGGTGTLTATVQGGANATAYAIQLQTSSGMCFDGQGGPATKSDTINGQGGAKSYTIYGQSAAYVTLTGTCPDATAANANATVVDVAVIFSKTELRIGISDTRADTVMVTATRNGGGSAVTVNLSVDNARASITSGATLTIPADQNQSQQVVTVRGNSASAADQDTKLEAKIDGTLKNSIPITVVVPTKWTNNSLGQALQDTNPTAVLVPDANPPNNWGVHWVVNVVFTVLDQFDKPLGSQWAGVQLWEKVDTDFWRGFHDQNQGDAISASAQATDPVQDLIPGLTQADALDIITNNPPSPSQTIGDNVITYKITDGTTTYNLSPNNRRVRQKKTIAGAFALTSLDTQQ